MKKIITLLFLVTMFTNHLLIAQSEKCGFDKILETKKNNTVFQQKRAAFERHVKQFANRADQRNTGGTVTIPCVVHIVHTGQAIGTVTTTGGIITGANPNDAQINSGIADMTDAFKHQGVYNQANKNGFYDASTDVEFVLAKRAPDGTATSGIIRHDVSSESWGTNFANNGMDAGDTPGVPHETIAAGRYWPPSDYMNIWIVHEIENAVTTLGFATFPQTTEGAIDALVMLASAFGYDLENDDGFLLDTGTNLNGTANHEVGHYLSLYHSFQGDDGGGVCPADLVCGTDSDCCADIPPHKQSSGCPADANDNTCAGGGPNIYIHNFMDYADDACFHGFSENQKTRMEAALSGPRKMFCTSLGATVPSSTYPTASTTQSITGADESMGIYDVVLNGTTFTSLSSYHDGGYLNRVASQPTISLVHATSYTITVQVGVGNTQYDELAAVYIDFNQNGDFTDTGEQLGVSAPSGGKKNGAIHSFTFTVPASGAAATGTRLRMRIITDFDDEVTPLTSTTSVSQGGQIEDYSIMLTLALPVDLISFDANSIDNKKVNLNWATASEINNSHFEIERSEDGERFSVIDIVKGEGNTTLTQRYEAVDKKPVVGLNYYRLKQVDFDGSFEYSKIEVAEIKSNSWKVYPNPANDVLFVEGIEDTNFHVLIYNQLGRLIKRIDTSDNELDISEIPTGVYYLQFTSSKINHLERIIINR